MDIWLLNKEFQAITLIDEYESFIWTDRYNEAGEFELYTTINSKWIDYIKKDYYLISNESDRTMIIENILIETDAEDGDKITVSGRSLEQILERRVIWGSRTFTSGSNLQGAIKTLIYENIIIPNDDRRKIPNFIFQDNLDPRVTELTFEAQYTGENLYDAIRKLCDEKQVGFKVVLNDKNQFVFSLYFGVDRSYDQNDRPYVIFSPKFDNIINSNYNETDVEYRNVGLVAGEGEGAARDFLGVGLEVSGLSRREAFINASDISHRTEDERELSHEEYKELLMQRGREELAKLKKTKLFEGEIEGTVMFKYNHDFYMGDILQVENEYGYQGKSRMTEMVTSHDNEGIKLYPTFTNLNDEGEPIK